MNAHLLAMHIPDFSVAVARAVAPTLRGRPVVVASSTKAMGWVVACSQEARAAGVREGMRVGVARPRCPDAAFLMQDEEQESRAEYALLQAAVSMTPCLERYGPGRLYLDVTGTQRLLGNPMDVATRLRHDIRDHYAMTPALGVSSRKVWSHLAAQAVSPDGIMELMPHRELDFLSLIPPDWVHGVGPKTRDILRDMNITNLGMLRQFTPDELVAAFGRAGRILWETIRQSDSPERVGAVEHIAALLPMTEGQVEATVTVSASGTGADALRGLLMRAVTLCGEKLRRQARATRRIKLTIAYADGRTESAQQTLTEATALDSELLAPAESLMQKIHTRRVRLSRVNLSCEDIVTPSTQGSLFPNPTRAQELHRLAAMDAIRIRYGAAAIRAGTELLAS